MAIEVNSKKIAAYSIGNESVEITGGMKKKKNEPRIPYLPHELIAEHIIPRLSVRDLLHYTCVSKIWYNSILKDDKFPSSHFIHSHKNHNFIFNLLNVLDEPIDKLHHRFNHYFFCLFSKNQSIDFRVSSLFLRNIGVIAGNCNGLLCNFPMAVEHLGAFGVYNPCRKQLLSVYPPKFNHYCIYICYGFGFDSLTNEYKIVYICHSLDEDDKKEFKCMVFTLGTKLWRKVNLSTFIPPRSAIRASSTSCKAATFCAATGDLCWRLLTSTTEPPVTNGYETEMLLTFNLHHEKLQFIRPPHECASSASTMATVEHKENRLYERLMEFKGLPCVPWLEKVIVNSDNIGCNHQHLHYHYSQSNSSSCCCCAKLHLYVLKDKVKQVWEEETLDIRIPSSASSILLLPPSPPPCCCCFDSTTTPPTRMTSFSGQIFLYWFDGECLQLYNLQSKHLKVVKLSCYDRKQRNILHSKMKGWLPDIGHDNDYKSDDNIYCSQMDYQLHGLVENFLSLETFLPEGETIRCEDKLGENPSFEGGKSPVAFLSAVKKSAVQHFFLY